MKSFKLLILLIFVTAGIGCSDTGGGPDADPGTLPVAELGTGTTDYETLTADQSLVLFAGPQGGHHFIVHARMQRMAPGDPARPGITENPVTRFSVFDAGGEQVDLMLPPYRLGYRMEESDSEWLYLPSGRILQLFEPEVARLFGTSVRIHVSVTDADGRSAEDDITVIATEEVLELPDAGMPDAASPDAGS